MYVQTTFFTRKVHGRFDYAFSQLTVSRQEHEDIIYFLALYISMAKRVMISIPDVQWEYLRKHPEIRLSGLVQQTINKIMVEEGVKE